MVYQYKVPYARVSAQTAGEELARIEKENGSLTPELPDDADVILLNNMGAGL